MFLHSFCGILPSWFWTCCQPAGKIWAYSWNQICRSFVWPPFWIFTSLKKCPSFSSRLASDSKSVGKNPIETVKKHCIWNKTRFLSLYLWLYVKSQISASYLYCKHGEPIVDSTEDLVPLFVCLLFVCLLVYLFTCLFVYLFTLR